MTTLSSGAARLARAPGRDWDGVQFRTILVLCLPVHLAAAAAARFTPRFWSKAGARVSLLAEAWQASAATAGIALSG